MKNTDRFGFDEEIDFLDFETTGAQSEIKYLVLIIYDISDNKQRLKISKFLEGYGFRVQKSAYEALLTKKQYNKMINNLNKIIKSDDNVRIYKIRGYGEVKVFGSKDYINDDVMII